jgi:protocatechuate 3,4-dioxygenase beta subunit
MTQPLSRRDLITRGLATATAFAAGLSGPNILSQTLRKDSLDLTPNDVCTLTCKSTIGPCFYEGRVEREDITEGQPGLPTLLSILVVNADTCQPVSGAKVDIWHANAAGIYSAPISQMCNDGNALAIASTFLRGIQTTDANGWVHFNTVYPGWYSSRAPHIHSTIRVNGSEMVTTQFFFSDDLSNSIYTNHAAYIPKGRADTSLVRDNVIGGSASRVNPFLFTPKLIGFKQLFALKVVGIRSSATQCSA